MKHLTIILIWFIIIYFAYEPVRDIINEIERKHAVMSSVLEKLKEF